MLRRRSSGESKSSAPEHIPKASAETKAGEEEGCVSDSEDEEVHLRHKVILLGDGTVGKTSMATRYTSDYFGKSYKQTIGLDFFTKKLTLPGGVNVTLQVWDIGGQTIGSKMIGNYIHGADAVLFCYDITNPISFQNLEDWFHLVNCVFADGKLPVCALVANKIDMEHDRAVAPSLHTSFAEENGFASFEVSAKDGTMVNFCFNKVAAALSDVNLTRAETRVGEKIIRAELVNYPRNDPKVKAPSPSTKPICTIQ